MNRSILLFPFLILLGLVACNKSNDVAVDDSNLLKGSWINPVANDSTLTYQRANSLNENEPGLAFKEAQSFLERKNAGFCGTPPITYADFEGSWDQDDSIINITVDYWGGQAFYEWKIESLTKTQLTIIRISEEYQGEF